MDLKQKPYSFFTCEINDGESKEILEDCYFKDIYGWGRGGIGSLKLFPYLKSTELIYKDRLYSGIAINEIYILDIYIYKYGERVSIKDKLINKYKIIRDKWKFEDIPFPIPRIEVYED